MVTYAPSIVSQDEAIQTVKSYVREIRALGIDIKKVILFGSYAKKKQREWSDIDVALIGNNFSGFLIDDVEPFCNINIRSEFIPIEIKTYNTSILNTYDPFFEEIKKDGIEIMC